MKMMFVFSILLVLFTIQPIHAQWVQTNGPYGGNVTSIAAHDSNIFIGISSGSIYRSQNMGESWQLTNFPSTQRTINTLIIKDSNIFAGTYPGVYLSTDHGTSWNLMNNGLPKTTVYALAISGTDIFAGTSIGVFLSTNNGVSWDSVNTGLGYRRVVAFAVNPDAIGEIYVATVYKIYRSTNNGTSWDSINTGLPPKKISSLALVDTTLYAGTSYGLYVSTNKGALWIRHPQGILSYSIRCFTSSGTRIYAGASNSGVLRSFDNGNTWDTVTTGMVSASVYAIALIPDSSDLILAGTRAGVSISTDRGSSWNKKDTGLINTTQSEILTKGQYLFAGTEFGLYRSANRGNSWELLNEDLPTSQVIDLDLLDTTMLVLFSSSRMYSSTDNGNTWNSVSISPTTYYINSLTVKGATLYAGAYNGFWYSTNHGTKWDSLNTGLTTSYIISLSTNSDSAGSIVANTTDGLFILGDTQSEWRKLETPFAPPYLYSAFTLHGTTIFVATNTGIFRSTDEGLSWDSSNTGIEDIIVNRFAEKDTNLFALSSNGIYKSTNNGESWNSVYSTTSGFYVTSMAFTDNHIFAGTLDNGVWTIPIDQIITNVHDELRSSYSLSQNYPNPFNPLTHINFALPKAGFVTLTIYDMLGREVTKLVSQHYNAGSYTIDWDASNVPTGVYIYRLQANDIVETKKLVVMR